SLRAERLLVPPYGLADAMFERIGRQRMPDRDFGQHRHVLHQRRQVGDREVMPCIYSQSNSVRTGCSFLQLFKLSLRALWTIITGTVRTGVKFDAIGPEFPCDSQLVQARIGIDEAGDPKTL